MVCLPYFGTLNFPLNIIYFILNAICAMISTTGNGIVLYAVLTVQRLHSPTNWLLASLALSDFISALVGQITYSIYITFFISTPNCLYERLSIYISAMSQAISLLVLCLITRDRYLHVAKGHLYQNFTSNKQVFVMVFISWFLGNALSLINNWQPVLGQICFASVWFASFVYIAVTYRRLHRTVRYHFRDFDKYNDKFKNANSQGAAFEITEAEVHGTKYCKRKILSEQKANKSILIIISLFVLVWFPFLVVLVVCFVYIASGTVMPSELTTSFVWTSIMSFANGAANPFIYAIRYKELGSEMKRILFCKKGNKTAIGVGTACSSGSS